MYMNKEYAPNKDSRKYLTELKTYCNIIFNTAIRLDLLFLIIES